MSSTPENQQPVWDLPVRLFHWALVGLVAFQAFSGLWGGPAEMVWHGRAGYAIFTLVVFRLAWGIVGGRHARFSDFVRGPGAVIRYLRSGTGSSSGHNPLGALSVIAMLAVLLVQAGTGLFANDDILFDGPLMHLVGKELSDTLTGYHYLSSRALLALVVLHFAAIAFYRLRGENLVTPMITGQKPGENETANPDRSTVPVMGSPIKAILVLAIAAGIVAGIVNI